MSNSSATDPKAQRVAIHELGHGATYYLIYGQPEPVFVYGNGGEWEGQQISPEKPPLGREPATRDEWRDVIAWTYAGWAAVNLAIGTGLLEPIAEARSGDVGFRGGRPADEWCVNEWAGQSGVDDPLELIEEGRELALVLLRPRLSALWALVPALIVGGYTEGTDIAAACS